VKRVSVEYRLLAAFLSGGLILGTAAWFALASGRDYLDASGRADRLADASSAIAGLMDTMQDAESSQRAYLLTGRDEYLVPYFGAPGAAQSQLARAHTVLEGDPEAGLHLARLGDLVPARLNDLKAAVEAVPRGHDAALRIVDNGPGNALMQGIRSEVHALGELVQQQMQASRERARTHGEDARHSVWLIGVLVIMLLSGTYAVLIAELHDRRRLTERLKQAANHDGPTGLPNRRFFGEWLGYAIAHARREVRHVGLLFIDVDGLKTVDELHGRDVADALLVEIARRFRETAREGDVLARIGANEFALAIPDVGDPREVAPLAQRLRDSLTDPARPPLADTPIGASVGVAFYPDDADDPAGVMAAADAAMYAAKGAGKNRVAFKPLVQVA